MKYRVIKVTWNGEQWFQVQAKRWWFPFWISVHSWGQDGGNYGARKFETEKNAIKFIEDSKQYNKREVREVI